MAQNVLEGDKEEGLKCQLKCSLKIMPKFCGRILDLTSRMSRFTPSLPQDKNVLSLIKQKKVHR
jgi:hypothetical protein